MDDVPGMCPGRFLSPLITLLATDSGQQIRNPSSVLRLGKSIDAIKHEILKKS